MGRYIIAVALILLISQSALCVVAAGNHDGLFDNLFKPASTQTQNQNQNQNQNQYPNKNQYQNQYPNANAQSGYSANTQNTPYNSNYNSNSNTNSNSNYGANTQSKYTSQSQGKKTIPSTSISTNQKYNPSPSPQCLAFLDSSVCIYQNELRTIHSAKKQNFPNCQSLKSSCSTAIVYGDPDTSTLQVNAICKVTRNGVNGYANLRSRILAVSANTYTTVCNMGALTKPK